MRCSLIIISVFLCCPWLQAQETDHDSALNTGATPIDVTPMVAETEVMTGTLGISLNPELQLLAAEFFSWRAVQQPVGGDDIPRVERPPGWLPSFSPADIAIYRVQYREFLKRLSAIDRAQFSRADEVDARAVEAAINRVGWELDVLRSPQRNPEFYVDQTLGSVFELLILSSPMTSQRVDEIVLRFRYFSTTVANAVLNLDQPVRSFAQAAIDSLNGIEDKLTAVQLGLLPLLNEDQATEMTEATELASQALVDYRIWLQLNMASTSEEFSIGEGSYQWFLLNVALIPNTPEELLQQGRQAWSRSVAWDALENNRDRNLPELSVFESSAEQITASFRNEQEIRAFLETQDLATVPSWLMHYRNRLMPAYLEPLAFMGVTNDLTSATRLAEDAYKYIPEPSGDLPFFQQASAVDPRLMIAHEGVPGHFFQMALSWANPNPIRRRFIDSSANEGIGFYVEEMLLQAGLFAFSPRSRELVYRFMRLRALRVEVDIRLAIGEFSIRQAADFLEKNVPLDRETALQEAVFFAAYPGQAISYQIGKLQVLRFLADARLDQAETFSLRAFHDYLMKNGNLPISLQRWEYLGREDDIQRLRMLSNQAATVPY